MERDELHRNMIRSIRPAKFVTTRIYEGQLAVDGRPSARIRRKFRHMAEQEKGDHPRQSSMRCLVKRGVLPPPCGRGLQSVLVGGGLCPWRGGHGADSGPEAADACTAGEGGSGKKNPEGSTTITAGGTA